MARGQVSDDGDGVMMVVLTIILLAGFGWCWIIFQWQHNLRHSSQGPSSPVDSDPNNRAQPGCELSSVPKNTREFLVKRMQQGVILKTSDKDQFADFGTGDPLHVAPCTICLVDYEQGDRVVTSNCSHVFHKNCLLEWVILNRDCPCCRQVFVDPEAASLRPVLQFDSERQLSEQMTVRQTRITL